MQPAWQAWQAWQAKHTTWATMSYTCATTHAQQMRRVPFGQCKGRWGQGWGCCSTAKCTYLFLRDAKLLLRDSIYKFQKINTSIWGIPYKHFWRFAPLDSYYRTISPWRGRGGTAIYGLYRYVPLWRVSFSSSWLWDMVYKSESLGLE